MTGFQEEKEEEEKRQKKEGKKVEEERKIGDTDTEIKESKEEWKMTRCPGEA